MINLHVARISSSTDGLSQENDSDHPVPAKTTPANAVGDAGFGSAFEKAWNRSAVCSRRFFVNPLGCVGYIPIKTSCLLVHLHRLCVVNIRRLYLMGIVMDCHHELGTPWEALETPTLISKENDFRTLLLKSMKSVEYQSVYSGFIWL